MDVGGSPLPERINPHNFPAKLWRLVNNPEYKAIGWDSDGEHVVINQHLFEKQVLSVSYFTSDNADAFRTNNFSSFVRQLNLYGFKKTCPAVKEGDHGLGVDDATSQHYYNPNFKKNHPELVASLRRLTVAIKAKLQAGLDVSCRTRSRRKRLSGGINQSVKRESPSLHQESAHPFQPKKAQAVTAHSGTPVPSRYLKRGSGAALSPVVFAKDEGMPVPLSHHYAGVASSFNAMHPQQSLLAHANYGNPNFPTFNPSRPPFLPGFYSSVYQCCQSNFFASHLAGSGFQTGPFSTQSYYQSGYPLNMHNQDPQNKEHPEVKKCDINLDAVFQFADELMPAPLNNCLDRVVTLEKPSLVLVTTPNTCNTNPASTMQARPLCAEPIVTAMQGNVHVVKFKQQEESVLSVPEQMPEDAICEQDDH